MATSADHDEKGGEEVDEGDRDKDNYAPESDCP